MSSGASSSDDGPKDEQEVVNIFNRMRSEHSQIASKIAELENDLHEHELVIKALSGLEKERKCFRHVGGVLVERNVGEVLPAVTQNKDGIHEILNRLNKQLEAKSNELREFQAKYKIKIKSGQQPEQGGSEGGKEEENASGVLA
eukprot:gb/GECH01012279.1/.p1 GENE.gb/GECH01012279.1/~~gb/GECH01012279.1/.p1  ORF type:complete len:144 (+),score=52.28 gb/GECH01012279.1/:1-432(+)